MPNQDDACFEIPAGRFPGLWKLERYSDVRVRLVSKCQSSNGGGSTAAGTVYKEFPAHKEVLEVGSSYFKGMFTTGQAIASHPSQEDGRAAKRARVQKGLQVAELPCANVAEAEAYELVIEFLYTHTLPASPTVNKLCRMIIAADYLGADLCVKACAISLTRLPLDQLSMPPVCNIMDRVHSCPPLVVQKLQDALWKSWDRICKCPGLDPAVIKTLQNALFECLLSSYTDTLAIINNTDLLLSFCKLPLRTIELWGRSDRLKVDSENTVMVLLNKWWHSQPSGRQAGECKKKLSALVRPALLTSGFLHGVLGKLKWSVSHSPTVQLSEVRHACMLVNTSGVESIHMQGAGFSDLVLTKRDSIRQQMLKLTLRISMEQMQQSLRGTGSCTIQSLPSYWQGHDWMLCFNMAVVDDNVVMTATVQRLPHELVPADIPTSAAISIKSRPFSRTEWKQRLVRIGKSYGKNVTFPKDSMFTQLKKYLTDDKHLVVTATVSNVQ